MEPVDYKIMIESVNMTSKIPNNLNQIIFIISPNWTVQFWTHSPKLSPAHPRKNSIDTQF